MKKILVLYYSMYGHTETMAKAVAEGAATINDVEVTVKRTPELIPESIAKKTGVKLEQDSAVAEPDELKKYDAIIFGTPTRFGNMASQMRNFLDQTGKLWQEGALIGKIGSVFTSTATGGGNETTIQSFHTTLIHHGMIVTGLPYSCKDLLDISEPRGGSPMGAGTMAGPDGLRQPSESELTMARFQGRHVAEITVMLG